MGLRGLRCLHRRHCRARRGWQCTACTRLGVSGNAWGSRRTVLCRSSCTRWRHSCARVPGSPRSAHGWDVLGEAVHVRRVFLMICKLMDEPWWRVRCGLRGISRGKRESNVENEGFARMRHLVMHGLARLIVALSCQAAELTRDSRRRQGLFRLRPPPSSWENLRPGHLSSQVTRFPPLNQRSLR